MNLPEFIKFSVTTQWIQVWSANQNETSNTRQQFHTTLSTGITM